MLSSTTRVFHIPSDVLGIVAYPVLYWSVEVRDIVVLMISPESNPGDTNSQCLPLLHLITSGDRLIAVVDLPETVLTALAPGATNKAFLQSQLDQLMVTLPWCSWREVHTIQLKQGGRRASASYTAKDGQGFSRVMLELNLSLSSQSVKDACAKIRENTRFTDHGQEDLESVGAQLEWPSYLDHLSNWPQSRKEATEWAKVTFFFFIAA